MFQIRHLAAFISLLIGLSATSQVAISGKIINDQTGAPISGVSVYINNSTLGSASNADGEFIIRNIKPGFYDLVVSHVAYDLVVRPIQVKGQNLQFEIRLKLREKVMRDVLVMTPNQRKKWMEIFKENFLGQTPAAERAIIENEDDIQFQSGSNSKSIKAYSDTPLVIVNRELGYRVYFDLQEFGFDDASARTWFYGYSRFEKLDTSKNANKKKYVRSRDRYYNGSTIHFLHSLIARRLEAEGFSMTLLVPLSATGGKEISNMQMGRLVTERDILFPDTAQANRLYLAWKGKLQVRYKRDPYYKTLLNRKGLSYGSLPTGIQSWIDMPKPPVYMDYNGGLENPLAIEFSGFWGYEKMANMLPIDYSPSTQ